MEEPVRHRHEHPGRPDQELGRAPGGREGGRRPARGDLRRTTPALVERAEEMREERRRMKRHETAGKGRRGLCRTARPLLPQPPSPGLGRLGHARSSTSRQTVNGWDSARCRWRDGSGSRSVSTERLRPAGCTSRTISTSGSSSCAGGRRDRKSEKPPEPEGPSDFSKQVTPSGASCQTRLPVRSI